MDVVVDAPLSPQQPSMVIFDRYVYDMAFDQRRSRIGLPDRVARWFIALAPKPDVISRLHGRPEGIAARNQVLNASCLQTRVAERL